MYDGIHVTSSVIKTGENLAFSWVGDI